MDFNEFDLWLRRNPKATALTEWVFLPPAQAPEAGLGQSFHQTLANISKLTVQEIMDLERRYFHLKARSPDLHNTTFDAKLLKPMACPPLSPQLLVRMCHRLDRNGDGHIDLKELAQGLSVVYRGSPEERLAWCFTLFDIDDDQALNADELMGMLGGLETLVDAAQGRERPANGRPERSMSSCSRTSLPDSFDEEDDEAPEPVEDPLPDPRLPLPRPRLPNMDKATATQQSILAEHAKASPGQLRSAEFVSWAQASGAMQPLLDALLQVCYVVFGFRPDSPRAEGQAVHQRMQHDKVIGAHTSVQATCYLVSPAWHSAWQRYTRGAPPPGEAPAPEPGPIHTGSLIRQPGLFEAKQVYSRWGPRLRRGLTPNRDYVQLSDHVWSILYHWYGGGPIVSRPIIEFPDGRTGPELYPISIKVLRHSAPPRSQDPTAAPALDKPPQVCGRPKRKILSQLL